MSALEAAGDLVGCVEGPGDLSTNKKYLEGPMSALEAAGDLVGCVEGPGDLSMKKRELKANKIIGFSCPLKVASKTL